MNARGKEAKTNPPPYLVGAAAAAAAAKVPKGARGLRPRQGLLPRHGVPVEGALHPAQLLFGICVCM